MKTFDEIYKLKEDWYDDRPSKPVIEAPSKELVNRWEEWAEKNFTDRYSCWEVSYVECFEPQDDVHDDIKAARFFIIFIAEPASREVWEKDRKPFKIAQAVANNRGDIEKAYGISSHARGPRRNFGVNYDESIFTKKEDGKYIEFDWMDEESSI